MKTKKDQNVEIKETNMINKREEEEEEDEEEEKKIESFFNLIKNYQETRKRRREELAENSGDLRKKMNVGERSGVVVPAFQLEDFSQCLTKPLVNVSDQTKVKQEEEEEKKVKEDNDDLDLNLAL
ncbi:hypothetical protein AALP_AA1G017500 [Arabis alpina]|uniref:Uncharacterized protein n=1 Tax=Arabis alpina TaxID=50452 RepID=A0A087HKF5_ARAAL|nr:hypothetical protein AALP_AA1G017500 [Arabis alpina]